MRSQAVTSWPVACSVATAAAPTLPRAPVTRTRNGASVERQVVEDEDLAARVEHRRVAALEQLDQDLGVLGVGADDVLVGAVVEDELEGEGAGRAALALRPGRLDVGDLPDRDLALGRVLVIGHRMDLRVGDGHCLPAPGGA